MMKCLLKLMDVSTEADGSLTLQWTDDRFCFNATGWDNETESDPIRCHCPEAELTSGLCACLKLGGDALVNISDWMWLPNLFILNSAGGEKRSSSGLEQTLMISQGGAITWSTRFTESLATDFSLDLMPFDSQNLTINIGGYQSHGLQLIWADDQKGHVGGNTSKNNSIQRSYEKEKYDKRANAALAPKGWDICSSSAPHGSRSGDGTEACGGAAAPQPCTSDPCLQYLVGLSRNSYSYMFSYIYPSMLLLGISYLALYVDKASPGRPGIHSVTVLTELTLANAQRTQLPPVNDNMWIMSFMNTMLCFHIAIFVEFGIVHYAERQHLNQLLVSQGATASPNGSVFSPGGRRSPISLGVNAGGDRGSLVHALELERAASPPTQRHGEPESWCAEIRQWHRHANKIDTLFQLAMPPCIGVTWLHMMFVVGYSYSYAYFVSTTSTLAVPTTV